MSAATHYFRKRSPAAKKAARQQHRGGMKLRRRARRLQRRQRRGMGGPLSVEQIRRMLASGPIGRPTLARALGARGVTTVIVNPSRRRGTMAKRRRRRRGGAATRARARARAARRRRGGRGPGRRRIVRRRRNPALGFLFRNPKSAAASSQGAFDFGQWPPAQKAAGGQGESYSAAEGRKAAQRAKAAATEAAQASHKTFVDALKPGPHPVFTDVFGGGLNKEAMRHELDPFGGGFTQAAWDDLRLKQAPFAMSPAQIYQAKVDGTYRPWMDHAKPPAFLRAKAVKAKKAATAAKKDAAKAKSAAKRATKAAAVVAKSKAPAEVKRAATASAKKAVKAAAAAETTAKVAKVAAKKTAQAAKAAKKGKKPSATVAKGKATPAEKKAVKKAAVKAAVQAAAPLSKAPAAPSSPAKKKKGRKGKAKAKGKKAAARRPATSSKRKGDRVMVKRDKGGRRVKRVSVVLKNPSLGSVKAMVKQTVTTAIPALAGGALMGLIDAKVLAGRQIGLRILGKLTAAGIAMALMRKYPRSAATMAGAMLGTLGYELLTRFAGGFVATSKEEVKKELGALVREDPYAMQGLINAAGMSYPQYPSLQGGQQYFPDEVHTG